MKNSLKLISISIFLIIYGINLRAQCTDQNSTPVQVSGTICESRNGYNAPTFGTIRVLLIFAEVLWNNPANDPYLLGTQDWPVGQLPVWKDDVFDPFYLGSNTVGEVTRFFQLASSENLKVLGDYLITPTNGIFQVTESNFGMNGVIDAVNTIMGGNFITAHGLAASDFDSFQLNSNDAGLSKSNSGDLKYDVAMVIYRNGPYNYPGGNGRTYWFNSSTASLLGHEFNNYIQMGAFHDQIPIACARHEFSHLLFGDNSFHTAGEIATNYEDYWVSRPNGWGILGLYGQSLMMWNGWDRMRMGWNASGSTFNPAARNLTNSVYVNGDLDPSNLTQAGIYYLRDFATSGDALRIKLPYTDPANEYPEFLWLESHGTYSKNGVKFDRFQHEPASCIYGAVPGLYVQMQIDREKTIGSVSDVFNSGFSLYTRPLTAEGSYDRIYENINIPLNCIGPASVHPFRLDPEFQNPLTGCGDQEYPGYNLNPNDNILTQLDVYENSIELINGNYVNALHGVGHSRCAFTLFGNNKLGIGTNPSTATANNVVGTNFPTSPSKNINKIYLNGVSVKILTQYPNGDAIIEVKFDDVDIENNIRWCAPSIILNPIPTPTGILLNIKTGKQVKLDQGKTATRMDNPVIINGEKLFTSPTYLQVLPTAWINLETGSSFIVDNNSTLALSPTSRIDIANGAQLIVKNGGLLELKGCTINVANGGSIKIEDSGKLDYYENTIINLNGVNAVLEINGMLNIKDDATFTFTYNTNNHGYVKFGNTTLFPSKNITAGTNSKINLQGSGVSKKILEVTQEMLYTPSSLSEFNLSTGVVKLATNSGIQINGQYVHSDINFIRFTSTIAGQNNGHKGLRLLGQPNTTIDHCVFENGRYGIDAYLQYSLLRVFNSTFYRNTHALFSIDKCVDVIGCHFNDNEIGFEAPFASYTTMADQCVMTSNDLFGIYWNSYSTGNLILNNPAIDFNQTGVSMWRSPLTAYCGSISSNNVGIELYEGASLLMDNNVLPSPNPPPNVTMFNNNTTISALGANSLMLNGGRNELRSSIVGTKMILMVS